ncbi:MAG: hypothetical protein ACR2LX_07875 [Jatrophihabitans sp.]
MTVSGGVGGAGLGSVALGGAATTGGVTSAVGGLASTGAGNTADLIALGVVLIASGAASIGLSRHRRLAVAADSGMTADNGSALLPPRGLG